jgi:hypothetical protein
MTPGEVQVLMNGLRMGGVAALYETPIAGITYMQFYQGTEAAARWGLGYGKGAIYLITTKAPPTSVTP